MQGKMLNILQKGQVLTSRSFWIENEIEDLNYVLLQ